MQQTANINALKALRERETVESMRRTFVRHKFAGKSFFFVALKIVWLVWKWVSKKRLKSSCKHQMNGPNGAQRAQHWTLKLSERLTETRMQNCLYLRVSMCVWYHYSGWIAYAYAQILISLWWMCARFYGFIRKRYYSMAFARVYRTKRVLTSDAINENCPAFSLFLISSLILSFMSELRPWKFSSLILKRLFVVKRTPDALNTMRIGSLCVPQFYRNWAKTSKDTSKENNASPSHYHSIP